MFTSIKLFKESLDNGLTEEQREDLKGRFEKILSINDFDGEIAEIEIDRELANLPEHQRDEAEEIWTNIIDEMEDEMEYEEEFESKKINESSINDLNNYLEDKSSRSGRFDFAYYVEPSNNDKVFLEVVADSKRGYPRDAFFAALSKGKPTLLNDWEYVTGIAVDYSNKPITKETILADDEYYDDRGYTDSEFAGSVRYEIRQKMNESQDMSDEQIDASNNHFNDMIYSIDKTKTITSNMASHLAQYCYDNYAEVTFQNTNDRDEEGDFPQIFYDLMEYYHVEPDEFQQAWDYYADLSN